MSMSDWAAFYALGVPAPQGSKTRLAHGAVVESSKGVRPWRQAVTEAAPAIAEALDGPLVARMVFTMPVPKNAGRPLRNPRIHPDGTPDLDKLARATCDAITDAGLWVSDARVVEFARLAKVWTGYDDEALPVPGVVVAVGPWVRGHRYGLQAAVQRQLAGAWERVRGAAG